MKQRCLGCMEQFETDVRVCPHCGYVVGTSSNEAIHMLPGSLFHDRYIIGKVLGFGGFGVTYIAWDGKLEQKVAIKEYLPSEFSTRAPGQSTVTVFSGDKSEQFHQGMKKFVDEAQKLAKYQNEDGIVKVFDSFEENGTAYIIMEYLDGVTLAQYIKENGCFGYNDAVDLLMPIMVSLNNVHADGLLHRDISPDNIFVTKTGDCKLIDFGASRFATTTHSRSLTVIVKPGYSPEEQYRSRGDQGPHTDVYSMSATIYYMVTGKVPPDAMVRRAKYEHENKDILIPPHKLCKNFPVNMEIAMLNALNVQIEDRTPDMATFIEELHANPPAKRIYGKIKKLDFYTWPMWLKALLGSIAALLVVFGVLLITGIIDFKSLYSNKVVLPDGVVQVPNVEGMYNEEAVLTLQNINLIPMAEGNIVSEYIEAGQIVLQNPGGGTFLDENSLVYLTVSCGNGEVIEAVNGIATVPYLIWDDVDSAKQKLEQAGLGEPNITEVYDDNVAAGLVISQSISAGTEVDEGTVLDIVVSKGPQLFSVPNVVGMTEADAKTTLINSGLVVTTEYEIDTSAVVGTALKQSPAANELVSKGSTVTITVCAEPDMVMITVPNIVGMTKSEAKSKLEDAGFVVTVLENYDNTVEKDKVISQSLVAGTQQTDGAAITIYVSNGPRTATISFNANGGSASESKRIVNVGDAIGDLPTATKSKYQFVGWFTSKDGGVRINSSTVISSQDSITYYAHWADNVYTVSFDGNGYSSSISSISVVDGQQYGSLPSISRDGYTFNGWFTSASGGMQITSSSIFNNSSNQTLYAQWTENVYTISFDANGGQVSSSSITLTHGKAYGTLPSASKNGYTFTGWYTSDGSQITSTSVFSSLSSETLYAHWSPVSMGVTLDANGGSVSPTTMTVYYDGTYDGLPTPSKTGYTFAGWSGSNGTVVSSTTVTNTTAHTLTASWTPISSTVSFDSNGGSSASAITVSYGSAYGTLPVPTKDDYGFVGWYDANGNQITSDTVVNFTTNQTLTAQWQKNAYTVSFDSNGGSDVSSIVVSNGSTYGTLSAPTRTGYTFLGWYDANGNQITSGTTVSISSNQTLTAYWQKITYSITLDSRGGSAVSSIDVDYGGSVSSLPTPSKSGYEFAGWYTASSGGTKVTSLSNVTANQTLYAHWWGSWSNWSTTNPGASSDTMQVESRGANKYSFYSYYYTGPGSVNQNRTYYVYYDYDDPNDPWSLTYLSYTLEAVNLNGLTTYNRDMTVAGFQLQNGNWANLDFNGAYYISATGHLYRLSSTTPITQYRYRTQQ